MITPDLAQLIESGVSIIVGTRDSALRPDCVRAVGARVGGNGNKNEDDGDSLTIFLPVATAGRSVANLLDNGRIAVTFCRICDHHTVQIKCSAVSIVRADANERGRVDLYRSALAAELELAGLPQHVVFRIDHWPCFAVTVRPATLFDQTPGPNAGALLGAEESQALFTPPQLETAVEPPLVSPVALEDIDDACFQGLVPSLLATCDRIGEPNVTYLSQVYALDDGHVALSCQFFNKTKRNLLENPFSAVQLYHPLTFESWRLQLRFEREEKDGPLFDSMATRIDVIASHTGMKGVFRLLSADVHRVLAAERLDGYLLADTTPPSSVPAPPAPGERLSELRSLQAISARIAGAGDLNSLLDTALAALDDLLGLGHSLVLLAEPARRQLRLVRSHGYADGEAPAETGARVAYDAGVIGAAASSQRLVRMAGVGSGLAYGRAIRGRMVRETPDRSLPPQVGLPGLADAQAQLALPMVVGCELVGVLAAESRDPLGFDDWDEAFLQIVASQIGARIRSLAADVGDGPHGSPGGSSTASSAGETPRTRRFVLYPDAETVFLDGEYLVRGVAAKILWKLLTADAETGRREMSNRELRLDRSLGLPSYRDNLESRLALLRKRLDERCPDVRLVSTRRGHFRLEAESAIELVEQAG